MPKTITLLLCLFAFAHCQSQSYSVLGTGANAINPQSLIFSITSDGLGNIFAGCGYPAGGTFSGHVEKWDGSSWSELGPADSLNGNGAVRCVITDGLNNVYAGGDFYDYLVNTSGFYVARWNGAAWAALNSISNPHYNNASIFSIARDASDNIYATEYYQNESFDTVYFYVAKWNGSVWSDLGAGPHPFHTDSIILSLATDETNGKVYAGGEFGDSTGYKYVAEWNGSNWSELGGAGSLAANNYIYTVAVDKSGNVYAAGAFTNQAGHKYIAKWDGAAWTDLGNSGASLQTEIPYAAFTSLCADTTGNIYVAGGLKDSTGYYVAKWNGLTWTKLYTDSIISYLCVDPAQNIYGAYTGISYIGIVPQGFVVKLNFNGTTGVSTIPNNDLQVSVYPNPAKHQLTIHACRAISSTEIMDIAGQTVAKQLFLHGTSEAITDVNELATGVYFLRTKTADGICVINKFVKE